MNASQKIKILSIDLSNRSFELEELPQIVVKQFIGGRGLGSYLLYQRVPPKTDPLSADNHLIFTAGPMSGTGFFYSSKSNITTKSPLTGIYLYSICSGLLAQEIRKAGLWAIDIKGISESPVYLMIQDGKAEFRDAASLWGMETAAAQRAMLGGLSAAKTATVGIGPAGEQLVRYAAAYVSGDLYRCFGRGGAGCVMGSKKLKGLVMTGSGKVDIPDIDRFKAAKQMILKRVKTDFRQWAESHSRYETAADLEWTNEMGIIPTRNWQTGQFEGWKGIDKSTTPVGWPEKARPCAPYCPTAGTREVTIQEGPYKGAHSDVEWETVYAFGSQCGVDKMEAIIAASQLCDEFGIDTMTAGVTIGFAMECFEKGLIGLKETEGIDLRFGNDQAMLAMLKKIIHQEGFGKELRKGSKALSEEIPGSEGFAMHAKGMEFGGYECRGLNGQALQFAISARGGCHHAYGLPARAETLDGSRLNIEGKGLQVKNAAIGRILADSMILCTFPGPVYTRGIMAEAISSMSPESLSVDDLNEAGERIMCQERLFNMGEGMSRADDILPQRLLNEPKPDGPTKGVTVPLEELKDQFYGAMGYDLVTGNPTDETLARLGIEQKN
jgi:aldehyde:ferredoxin oxidoreductase